MNEASIVKLLDSAERLIRESLDSTRGRIIPSSDGKTSVDYLLGAALSAIILYKKRNFYRQSPHTEKSLPDNQKAIEEAKKKNRTLTQLVEKMKESANHRNKALDRSERELRFLKERVIQKYGRLAYMDLMAHIDNPSGFDIENFKKVHLIRSHREREKI